MRIVFAEQHAMVRDGLRPFLAELSPEVLVCEVDCAVHLPRAFAEARTLDHAIPELRLEDCLNALKALHPTTCAVVLSPTADRAAIARAMVLGAAGYVPKSLNARAFVSALRHVLAGERYVPAIRRSTCRDCWPGAAPQAGASAARTACPLPMSQ